MTTFIRLHWRTGLAFLIGVLVGPGALWRLLETRSAERNTDVQVMSLSLDARGRLNDLLLALVRESALFEAIRDCDSSTATYNVQLKLSETDDRLALIANDILSIEEQLASIERRPPRDIVLKWLRPRASGPIRVYQILPSGESIRVAGPPENARPPCPRV